MKIRFSATHIPRLALFMAKNDIRYYLNGIYVEKAKDREGIYLVATDGHTMAVIYDKDGLIQGTESVIMRVPPALVTACKRKSGLPNFVLVDGKRVSVAPDFGLEHTGCEEYVLAGEPFIDGKFPNFSKILPDFHKLKKGFDCPISPKYLARLHQLSTKKLANSVVFWQETKASVIAVQHSHIPEMLSLIMPMSDYSSYGKFDQFSARGEA